MYKIYGIKNIESFDQQLYESALKKMPIQEPQVYSVSLISDSIQFSKYTEVFKDLGEKNSKQPIQILYFNENKLSSFHANCFAKGTFTGNLKWNYRGDFDRFLPKSAIELPEGIPTVEHILKIYPLENKSNYQTTILFFWTNILQKQSIDAFNTIIKNMKTRTQLESIQLIMINTDKAFIEYFKENDAE